MLKAFREWQHRRRLKRYSAMKPQEVFGTIFTGNKWKGAESRSGKGSDLSQTRDLIETLPAFLREHGVRRFLDVPCGDFNWMQHADLSGIDYTGGDIVPGLIEANKRFARDDVRFMVLDLIEDEHPEADLVMVRDCLVHLSFAHARGAIENIRRSPVRWLLTTHFPEATENADIVTGQWRALNLERPPFSFPPPRATLVESLAPVEARPKTLALWSVADLPAMRS